MCGITAFFANKSVPNEQFFDILFSGAEKRGQNGFGFIILDSSNNYNYKQIWKTSSSYSEVKEEVLDQVQKNLKLNDILLAIARNTPETEELTDSDDLENTLQPMIFDDFVYVHNGAISERIVDKYKDQLKTKIDSEAIGLSYIEHNRNLQKALESIQGGWSLIMVDKSKRKILAATSFLPLAHGYDFSAGLIYHSSADTIRLALGHLRGIKGPVKFTRIWEDFYVDELLPFHIEQIDIDSGLVSDQDYEHNFNINLLKEKKPAYLVACSGGIDSTATLVYLLENDKDAIIFPFHFNYGQKSASAESRAFETIIEELNLTQRSTIVHLEDLFKNFSILSMLHNPNIKITTAKNVKSTDAWVPNRNGIFLNVMMGYAEHLVESKEFSEVILSAGFPNISEESVYPDNSQRFVNAILNSFTYSTLIGNRISYVNPMAGLTKVEELQLLKYYEKEYLFGLTVSCDNAILRDGDVYQCSYKGLPACGSGKLSYLAALKAGIKDTRKYYEISPEEYVENEMPSYVNNQTKIKPINIEKILERVRSQWM
jgi:7-cyano-7-deazaguanine synthase in queuosine biosynthesis